jgi:uncharacterized protein (DUF2062 family)
MFRKREKGSFFKRCINFFWPSMGWLRIGNYWAHRISRLPGSSYSIASGFACGAAISFTPFVGLHFILGGFLAWSMRSNVLASAIGTSVGNPWTFPFIWFWIYNLGVWMGFGTRGTEEEVLDFAAIFGHVSEAVLKFDVAHLTETAWPIFSPMLVGSVPTTIVAWFLSYYLVRYILNSNRRARFERVKARRGVDFVMTDKRQS